MTIERDGHGLEAAKPQADSAKAGLTIAAANAGALITLDRPSVLNALDSGMLGAIAAALPRFARDPQIYALIIRARAARGFFCAGGDLRKLVDVARSDIGAARRTLYDEYTLNWQLDCFTKPTISLVDGAVMGSGAGLTLYGTHRVAGERYAFAMPETKIGFFPDVGVCQVLARLPHEIGTYLALTGRRVGRADAYALGLVTHCINAADFDAISAGLCDADPVDHLLDERHEEPGAGELADLAPVIAQCFGAPGVEQIIANLDAVRGAHLVWARDCASELASSSPLSLKVTHRLIGAARTMNLRQTLNFDYRLACRFLDDRDFYEGVRAALIDKDNAPGWSPARLEDVSDASVDAYFASLGDDELDLPPREDVQAARF